MSVLFYGLFLIIVAFLTQVFIWKIHLPRNHTKVLLQIFFGTLIVGILIFLRFRTYIIFFGISPPATVYEYLQLTFLFLSLTMAYITTYSALEVDSPSLVMVMKIAKAGSNGLKKESFEHEMDDGILVVPRIRDLITGGMTNLDEGRYKLTPKGVLVSRIFIAYRKLMNRNGKGG